MNCDDIVKARVTAETKQQVSAAAERELMTEAAWLKRLVIRELAASQSEDEMVRVPSKAEDARQASARQKRGRRRLVFVSLRPDEMLLLNARAGARGMRPATYVATLIRSHLSQLVPVPKDELQALRRSINELSAIGRNINQIARAANEGGRMPATAREEFRAMLKICEGLRDNTRALMKANLNSWKVGYGENV